MWFTRNLTDPEEGWGSVSCAPGRTKAETARVRGEPQGQSVGKTRAAYSPTGTEGHRAQWLERVANGTQGEFF